ncbi:MAG: HEAT repeat domain-containing protein [Kiritimatiellaeota bacterium]|nr:HEAT repeat domain-containing protein [Kiritimatiellota bacterium]
MNRSQTLLTALLVSVTCSSCRSFRASFLLGGGPARRPRIEYDATSLDAAFAEIRTYRFGAGDKALRTVADLVRRTSDAPVRRRDLAVRLRALLTDTAATDDAKRFACRGLAVIASPADVPALAALLPDPVLSDMARYALERIPGEAAEGALIDAIAKTTGKVRIGVVNSLRERADARALPALRPLLGSTDAEIAAAAAAAAAKIGTPAALEAIHTAAGSAPLPAHGAFTEALLICAEKAAAADSAAAAAIAEQVFRNASAPHVKAAALGALVGVRRTGSVPLIVGLLADGESGDQGIAIRFVREMPGHEATRAFAAQLPALQGLGKIRLINALADRGDPAAAAAIQGQLNNADPSVRQAAASALGDLGDSTAVPALVRVAATGSGPEKRSAREALVRLKGRRVNRIMVRGLDSGDPAVVREFARALGERRAVAAVPSLLRVAARHPDPTVRTEADKALTGLAGPDRLGRLIELVLAARGPTERDATVRALTAAVRRKGPAPESVQKRIRAAIEGKADPLARAALLRVLGRLGGRIGFATVQKALAAGRPEVRDAAVRALADWPDPTPVPSLLYLAKSSDEEVTRVLCLRGLVRLLGQPSERSDAETAALFRQAFAAAHRREEKRMVLSGLARLASPQALDVALPYIADNDLAPEAVAAVVGVCEKLAATDRAAAEGALTAAEAGVRDRDLRDRLRAAIEQIRMYDDFISRWEIAGPYMHDKMKNRELFDYAFPPEPGAAPAGASAVQWRVNTPSDNPREAWIVSLDRMEALKGDNRVAYLRSWVWSPDSMAVRLEIGSDDGIRVWLNDGVVLAQNVNRGLARGQDRIDVRFRSGWNRLLLKVTQGSGFWSACVRVRTPQGEHVPGLRYYGTEAGLDACRADMVDGTDPRRRAAALEVLAEWPEPEHALNLLLDHLDVAGAMRAATNLVKRLARTTPDHAAEAALEKLADRAPSTAVQAEIAALRSELNRYRGYIKCWLVSGPYPPPADKTPFTAVCPAEPGGIGAVGPIRLVRLPAAATRQAAVVDLGKLFGRRKNCAACLRTVVYTPEALDARLELGSDDGVKVWLNGRPVHANSDVRPLQPAEDNVDIRLVKGWNSLLFKVTQAAGEWALCARIVGPDGDPMPGLIVEAGGEKQPLWPDATDNKATDAPKKKNTAP